MLKYAKSDIRDGLNSLKIGIGNVIASLIRHEIHEFSLDMSLDYIIVLKMIQYMFPEAYFKYVDDILYITVEGVNIRVVFDTENTIFTII